MQEMIAILARQSQGTSWLTRVICSYRAANLLVENGADCVLKGAGGFSAQQLVEMFNITCCRHIMRSNLTLPMLTKATKNHLKLVLQKCSESIYLSTNL